MNYPEFVASKGMIAPDRGFGIETAALSPVLFPFQREIVAWALRRGTAAIFADTGLGKTLMQLEWARCIAERTNGQVLILTPLAVAQQTVREARKLDLAGVTYSRTPTGAAITVTNYEMLKHFDANDYVGVVLDESSILKTYTGKTKQALINEFEATPYKLACTATPAPNDHMELGNHAQFLSVMESTEMLSRWFINDTMKAGVYRLKNHARDDFWTWVASWAVCVSRPSDMGDFDDTPFKLPPLVIEQHVVQVDHSTAEGQLFRGSALSATNLHREMRLTAADRAEQVAALVNGTTEPWLVWCNTNYEADELRVRIPDAVEVRGNDSVADKESNLEAFALGDIRVLVTKPTIAGFGLNYQHCHRMAFVGLSYSYEQLYQALRRSYRFGQKSSVEAHIVIAESEMGVLENIQAKQQAHEEMQAEMVNAMRGKRANQIDRRYTLIEKTEASERPGVWTLHLGDCVDVTKALDSDSIDFTIHSPPFSNLYIYTADPRDMGNTADDDEFFEHYSYLIPELYRVTKPGRLCAVHCKDLPLYKNRDGAAGLRDFPGRVIAEFEKSGWTYHSRVTIWKDPVTEMQRTKNHGLLHKNFSSRAEVTRQGMADYMVVFRKWTPDMPDQQVSQTRVPGDYVGTEPPEYYSDERDYSIKVWQRYASPVWFDINQTNVLNIKQARDHDDEKHICPLQLDVIRRCVDLWTNPGDLVYSPFAGIGSEGYEAVRMDRRFVGAELKDRYFEHAVEHLRAAEFESNQVGLFEMAGA